MANISRYQNSKDVFERASYWLAAISWETQGTFEMLQQLSEDVDAESKALRSENARLKQNIKSFIVELGGNV